MVSDCAMCDKTSLVSVAVTFAFLVGCEYRADPAGSTGAANTPPPPAEGAGQAPGMPARLLVDGFESGSIAGFWLPGTYGSGLYEPGAVAVSNDYARSGVWSARITVNEGDIDRKGDDGLRVERAELDSGHYPLLGRDVWYGFSFLLPPTFPIVDNRLVIASWKQSDVEGSPLIGQRFRDGVHSLTVRPPGAGGSGRHYRLPDIRLGRWTDMVYHFRYSSGRDGRIEVWMGGARVVVYDGPTASKDGADRFYNKVGLYRDRWKEPMTMYVDNYTLGDSFDRVDPSKFDQRP
jgi:hypothetical protein